MWYTLLKDVYQNNKNSVPMIIKRTISFYLQKTYAGSDNREYQIRLRIRWDGKILQFNCGYSIDPKKWNGEVSRCKKNTFNQKGVPAADINKELNRLDELSNDVFKMFEVQETMPTVEEYKAEFNTRNGKKVSIPPKEKTFDICFLEFLSTQSSLNSWADSTIRKFNTLKRYLNKMSPDLKMSAFNSQFYLKYIEYLRDVAEMQNTSILKMWKMLTWFLRWADKKGYLSDRSYLDFKPGLKTVRDKEIVFLTWDELMRVYTLKFPAGKKHLERVRDVFCFQCFTSLRYSDVSRLKRKDISRGIIKIVTAKTGDTIKINLNKYSQAILDKYKKEERPLPVVSNQKMNEWIKEVCYLAEIDQPVTDVYYKGAERVEETHPKYELVGTHTGRRTFICNALAMGIPPATVMEWTGHSDYKSMKPYIKIADDEKAKAMELFNNR